MSALKINMIVWGSMLLIGAIFVVPLLLLDLDRFLGIMPLLFTAVFAIIIAIVAVVLFKVFIGAGRKKAATIESGEDAEATILSVTDTGVTLQNGLYFQVNFDLEVRPAVGASYMASVKDYVSRVSIAQYQPGTVLRVKYNPAKREEVAITGVAGATSTGGATSTADAADAAAPVFGSDEARVPVFESDAAGTPPGKPVAAAGGFNRRNMIIMLIVPLAISVIAVLLPLLLFYKKDAVAGLFIEKAVGKYEITSATYIDNYTTPESSVFKPEDGSKWVMVKLIVKNTGSKTMDIPRTQLSLITGDGVEYAPEIVVDTGNDFDVRNLAPDATSSGSVVYEIPLNSVPASIRNMWGDQTQLSVAGA